MAAAAGRGSSVQRPMRVRTGSQRQAARGTHISCAISFAVNEALALESRKIPRRTPKLPRSLFESRDKKRLHPRELVPIDQFERREIAKFLEQPRQLRARDAETFAQSFDRQAVAFYAREFFGIEIPFRAQAERFFQRALV